MILANLNLPLAPMPPTKVGLNLTEFGSRCGFKRWPAWIAKRNDLSNFESLCHSNASHQVSAQSNLLFGRCRLKNSNMAAMAAILDISMDQF